jgi:succinate dehydrogenase/fumarate reductase flavoprotein subunit
MESISSDRSGGTEMTGDVYADVVIVGAGPGGVAAAFAANAAGADVALIERTASVGGNAPMSTGYIALVGTPPQRENGVEDSVDCFMEDVLTELDRERPHFPIVFDEALTRRYAEESQETYAFLTELGVRFSRFIPRPRQHSVDRLLAVDSPATLETHLGKAPGRLILRTGAQRLVTEGGRVSGVVVLDEVTWETYVVHASRGVILAAGGYQASHEFRKRVQPGNLFKAPYVGLKTCQGDGHRMGDAVGGDLVNMTMIPMLVRVASALVEECIAVNPAGERFSDEAGPYSERLAALERQEGGTGYYICDDITYQRREDVIEQMPGEPIRAGSLAALAEAIRCPAPALIDAVDRWNEFLASDRDSDPDFGRVVLPEERRRLSQPPFVALKMTPGVTFPAGGFRTTVDLQVLDPFEDPIPGLFAVGDCLGGVNPVAGLGGIHLGSAFTLGRAAGEAAARAWTGPRRSPQ